MQMQNPKGNIAWPLVLAVVMVACGGAGSKLTEIQRVKAGMLDVIVLSPHEALKQKDTVTIEFRSNGNLVDVGDVKGSASMSMSGTPMLGSVDVKRGDQPGRYTAAMQLDMAGTWRLTLEWKGPAGQGSTSFSSSVQ
jgi:YtkA-like protein